MRQTMASATQTGAGRSCTGQRARPGQLPRNVINPEWPSGPESAQIAEYSPQHRSLLGRSSRAEKFQIDHACMSVQGEREAHADAFTCYARVVLPHCGIRIGSCSAGY